MLPGTITVKFHAVAVRVAQINSLAHTVVRSAIEFDVRREHTSQRIRQQRTRRIKDGNVIQSGRAGSWRRTASTLPCIQSDVMMITTGGKKRRLTPHALRDLEAQHVAIKSKRAFEIGDLEMDMADFDPCINRLWRGISVHAYILSMRRSESSSKDTGSDFARAALFFFC